MNKYKKDLEKVSNGELIWELEQWAKRPLKERLEPLRLIRRELMKRLGVK